MTFEINFSPTGARKGRPDMAYVITAPSLVDATRIARQSVNIEAPGYRLNGTRQLGEAA